VSAGIQVCNDVDTCMPGEPSPEVCDNIDNDCYGLIDNEAFHNGNQCTTTYCVDGVILSEPVDDGR
jgi:hypothetical protein